MRIVYDIHGPISTSCGGQCYAHTVTTPEPPPYPGTKISLVMCWDSDQDLDAIHIEGRADDILAGLREAIELTEALDAACRAEYPKIIEEHYAAQHQRWLKNQEPQP